MSSRVVLPPSIDSDKNRYILEVFETELARIDMRYLYTMLVGDVPADQLPYVARFFNVNNIEYQLADDAGRRELIVDALMIAARKGTMWAIRRVCEILEILPAVTLTEWHEFTPAEDPFWFMVELDLARTEISGLRLDRLYILLDTYKRGVDSYDIVCNTPIDHRYSVGAVQTTIETEVSGDGAYDMALSDESGNPLTDESGNILMIEEDI